MQNKIITFMLVAILAITGTLLVPSTDVSAASIELDKTKATIKVGDYCVINAIGTTAKKTCEWSTSSKSIKLEYSGPTCKVTGIKAGTAKVSCKYNKKTYTCTIKVKAKSGVAYTSKGRSTRGLLFSTRIAENETSLIGYFDAGAFSDIKYEGLQNTSALAIKTGKFTAENSEIYLTDDDESNSFTVYGIFINGLPVGDLYVDFTNGDSMIVSFDIYSNVQAATVYHADESYDEYVFSSNAKAEFSKDFTASVTRYAKNGGLKEATHTYSSK